MFSVQHSFFRGKTSWLLVQKSSCLSRPPKVWCVGRALSRWDLKKTMALPKDQLENHLHHVEIYGSLFLTLELLHIDSFCQFYVCSENQHFVSDFIQQVTEVESLLSHDQLEDHLDHVEIYGSLFLTLVHIDAFYFFSVWSIRSSKHPNDPQMQLHEVDWSTQRSAGK